MRASRLVLTEAERRAAGWEPDRRFDLFLEQTADAYDALAAAGVKVAPEGE